jgi:2',3'-cyclic-nucleotide 2'-phosphodiesterase (5'-nucleotidase family)
MLRKIVPFLLSFYCLTGCTPAKQTTTLNYHGYRVTPQTKVDSSMYKMIATYKDSVEKTMNQVIGFTTKGLTKKQPESELGNFMADAMLQMASQKFKRKVHLAFMNQGGIRSYIAKGDITVGKIFELMPFDNLLVLVDVKGDVLQQMLDMIAERRGAGLAGVQVKIKEKKAVEVLIDGKPINPNSFYTLACSDYTANGGGEGEVLKAQQQTNMGYLLRDAFVEFIQQITKQGKPIDWKVEGRITVQN